MAQVGRWGQRLLFTSLCQTPVEQPLLVNIRTSLWCRQTILLQVVRGEFSRNSQNIPTPCILRPRWRGCAWNWVSVCGVVKVVWRYLQPQNRIRVQMHPWMLVETTHVTEFEYYFACTRKGVYVDSVMSPGKIAVLELWMSPLHWVLNWQVFNIYFLSRNVNVIIFNIIKQNKIEFKPTCFKGIGT